ncbi:MAG: hypothetical protein IT242_08135 [Bacteroidia bacterium]|nr:hypothetical protein [Bacteroidia bacterium]
MQKNKTMNFISSGAFWGLIIVLIGLTIILREVFHLHIPFLRFIFGALLIYWGVKIIAGGFIRHHPSNSAVFSESDFTYDEQRSDYNIIFGRGSLDLFKTAVPASDKNIEVQVVFGEGRIILNDSIPAKVNMSAVFGSVVAGEKGANGFGNTTFYTSAYREGMPAYILDANAVFGRIEIESRKW